MLPDPSTDHAEVLGLDDDCHPTRLEDLIESISDLAGEALLDLETSSEAVHQTRELG